MVKCSDQFALSTEIECLTAVPDSPNETGAVVAKFLQMMSESVPTLPATQGSFNGYAKLYSDVGHVEVALVEADDPYLLPSLFERVQTLATHVVDQLAEQGTRLVLANNNHSGLLQEGCAVWGDHENYLVEQHPSTFGDHILPFLATRVYQGAGGIQFPSGNYLAAVRPLCMELASGGGTTERRAIHSTAREEHHMGSQTARFRYHLILGDGHRSHYNLALQFGATALALKAVLFDPQLQRQVRLLRREFPADWVQALRTMNVLAAPGETPRVHPLVIKTQRFYLAAAERYADRLSTPPAWIARMLGDWRETLDALERMDRPWLAARLDAFAKYEFYSAVLADSGRTWNSLPGDDRLFSELALLDHSYHEFCNSRSVFARLESAGLLQHRVGRRVLPGEEAEPFVPETSTRARARARFIRDHAGNQQFSVDWSWIHDMAGNRRACLADPFAKEIGHWQQQPVHREDRLPLRAELSLGDVLAAYDRGHYELAAVGLERAERMYRMIGETPPTDAGRFRAWIHTQLGVDDGIASLEQVYAGQSWNLQQITDFCCVYRFQGLMPDLSRMEPWIERGKQLLERDDVARNQAMSVVFLEHVAYARLRGGHLDEAWRVIEPLISDERQARAGVHMKGRILATAAEICRAKGDLRRGNRLLRGALRHQRQFGQEGYLGRFTYPYLAKRQRTRRRAQQWLNRAKELQLRNSHGLGHAQTLLLEVRCGEGADAQETRRQVELYRQQLPALRGCCLLERLLTHWDAWTSGEMLDDLSDPFWGL